MGFFEKIFGISKVQDRAKTRSRHQAGKSPNFTSATEFGQVLDIFDWVFSADESTANEAALAVHRILNDHVPYKSAFLYTSFRYIDIEVSEITIFEKFEPELREALLCVASLNRNGFVREKALSNLSRNRIEFSFPFILFRLNDWVKEVRELAESVIREMIALSDTEFLIRNHKLINWLLTVERTDLKQLHAEITDGIFSPNNAAKLLSNIDKYAEGERFYVYKNLISRDLLSQVNLESLFTDKNYLIRLFAAKTFEVSKNPEILRMLLRDKSQIVRRFALRRIEEDQLSAFQPELTKLLVDDSELIRSEARKLLSSVEEIDYYQYYKNSFDQKPSVGNVIGLSEVGTKEDILKIKEVLISIRAKLRAAALFAISNLDHPAAKELCFAYLSDGSKKVKETCARVITKTVLPNDLEKLRMIYDEGNKDTKRITIRIIKNYGGWSIAGDFLKGLNETDIKLRDLSHALLSGWYDYSIRLGTELKKSDRDYVLGIFQHLDLEDLPYRVKEIAEKIPFIFEEK